MLVAAQVYVLLHLATSVWTFRVVSRLLGVAERETLRRVLLGLPVSLFALCAPAMALLFDVESRVGAVATVLGSGAVMAVMWLAALVMFRHPFAAELLATWRDARSARRPRAE